MTQLERPRPQTVVRNVPERRGRVDHSQQPNAVPDYPGSPNHHVPGRPENPDGSTQVPVVPTDPVGAV